ncbi:MAG TPA: oligosaccharide flippase family protein, partial [bacterium]|nr:oligosaccharide flippase family protein [bacterium]
MNLMKVKNKERSILKDGLYVLISNYFAQACNILRSFYSANILGPAGYGFWSIIQFYTEFGKFSPLGMDESVSREITQNILKNRTKENLYAIKVYFIYSLLLSFLTILVGAAFIFFWGDPDNKIQYYGIIFVTTSLVAWQMDRLAYTLLSAYGKFNYTSLMRALYAVISLAIVITLINRLQILAMYLSYFWATLIPPLIILIIYYKTVINNLKTIKKTSTIQREHLKILFKNSISLLTVSVLNTLLSTLDRFFVAQNYSNYDNGIYFFASNIAMSLNFFIFSFTVVIYQRMNLSYGEHSDHKIMFEYIIKACRKAAIYFPYVIILAYYVIPSFFVLMFAEYVSSIFFLRCFVFAGYFYSIFMLLNYELMTIKKQKLLNIVYTFIITLGSIIYLIISKNFSISMMPYIVITLSVILMLTNLYLSRKISGGIYKKRKLLLSLLFTPAILLIIMK